MSTLAAHLTALIRQAADAAGLHDASVPLEPCVPTRDPAHGDYQSNFAFRLAKAAKQNPRAVAERLVAALPKDPALAGAEVAGPGFVNLRLADAFLAADLQARASHPKLGASEPGRGRTVVIDYSSPNVAKRMHVGHLRSTIIGHALDRMHRFLGWTVIADNHVGDWGTPFGKLIVAWHEWRDDAAYAADPVGELQRLYQLADEKGKEDPAILDRARAATVRLQEGDPETLALWQRFVDASMAEFDGIYARLGITFDAVLGESAYRHELQPLVDALLDTGVAQLSEGAVVIRFDDDKSLADHPMLIRKGDGAALYGTTDLATVRHRVRTWHPERIVYVTDTRQQLHFRQVFAGARKMGLVGPALEHVWFGMLKFPDGAVASTRKGQVINLVDVLDTAAEKAYGVVTEKSPDLPEAERRDIAEAVGVGTIRYFDLSQNPQSDLTFSWDKALSLDGGSAVYLMYAYARLHSILRAGGAAHAPPDAAPSVEHPAERALAMAAARLPEVVEVATDTFKPNLLAEHLEALAKAVGPFYEHCPVLRDGVDPDLRARRLSLVYAVARSLEVGMGLLGLRAVPRM